MKNAGKVLTLVATLVLLSFPFVVWWKAQAIVDWWALKDYKPPARIAQIATDSSMTAYARHIFYVNRPELISDAAQFRRQCPNNEKTIVLGCYHSNQRGIDIYDVTDPRLSGIHEVTAAHEMLHAAYDRLDDEDKAEVNRQLDDYFHNSLKDERIVETLKTYDGLEQDEMLNEMHSIFGTEAQDLPPVLERHYSKYFISRQTVVGLAENYDSEFYNRINAIEDYERRIAELKNEIDAQSASLERQRERIVSDRRRLDTLRESGMLEQYNAGVWAFNAQVDAYNAAVADLRHKINTYNTLVEEHNALARELRSLEESIDTRLIPAPVQ